MIYKEIGETRSGKKLYAKIDNDGVCRETCSESHPPFQEWVAEGNEPEPADEPA